MSDPEQPSTPDTPDAPDASGARAGKDRPAPSRWSTEKYPQFDPWSAMSSIMAGVLLWGLIGYGLSRWLRIEALAGLGILIGGVLGIVVVYLRYGRPQSGPPSQARHGATPAERGHRPTATPPSPAQEEKP
jgi:ATP synthase protein I